MGSASKKTASICTLDKAVGTYVFEIDGYSLKKGIGIGKYVRSPAFTVGDHDWAIRFYPDGATEYPKDRVAIAVELMSKNAQARAFFKVRVVDQAKEKGGHTVAVLRKPRLFKGSGLTYKVYKRRRHVLEGSRSCFIQNDRLLLECVLTVIKEPQMYEVEVPPSNITEHLGELLEAKKGADVTFSVGGETFEAHKIVLAARSPVFEAEFYGLMKERTAQHVTIEDMQPAVFRALLHFIYKDSLPDLDDLEGDEHYEMIWHLLVAADIYAVDRLKLMCQNILAKKLNVETVATTSFLADKHNCSKLRDVCIDFLASSDKMNRVMATEGYANLKSSCPSILVDVLEKIIKFPKA